MKDTKHIRRNFNSVMWVMPQGSDFGVLGVIRGDQNIIFSNMVMWQSNWQGWPAEQNASKIFILGSNWWPWVEVKRSNIIKFRLRCQFQDFNNKLCVRCTNERYKHIRWDFHSVTLVMPKRWDFGALGVPREVKNFFFKHSHVAYQIDGGYEQNKIQVKYSS